MVPVFRVGFGVSVDTDICAAYAEGMATSAQDYYTIQSSASLTFTLIHQLMDRIPIASAEWNELRALGQLATQISGAAYDAARAIAESAPVPDRLAPVVSHAAAGHYVEAYDEEPF